MQREDSKRMQELADESRRIAVDSRRIAERTLLGSEEMKHLAADAKKLSEAMRVDSVALRSISITTMIFLPGTAIAVSQTFTLHSILVPGTQRLMAYRQSLAWARSSLPLQTAISSSLNSFGYIGCPRSPSPFSSSASGGFGQGQRRNESSGRSCRPTLNLINRGIRHQTVWSIRLVLCLESQLARNFRQRLPLR